MVFGFVITLKEDEPFPVSNTTKDGCKYGIMSKLHVAKIKRPLFYFSVCVYIERGNKCENIILTNKLTEDTHTEYTQSTHTSYIFETPPQYSVHSDGRDTM